MICLETCPFEQTVTQENCPATLGQQNCCLLEKEEVIVEGKDFELRTTNETAIPPHPKYLTIQMVSRGDAFVNDDEKSTSGDTSEFFDDKDLVSQLEQKYTVELTEENVLKYYEINSGSKLQLEIKTFDENNQTFTSDSSTSIKIKFLNDQVPD